MEQVGTDRGAQGHNGTIVARAMISESHSCPTHCKVFLGGGGGGWWQKRFEGRQWEFCRCLQGAAPICEEQHGRKHKGACVTTLATGWQSWHHSQQHGAWSWYHKGYLRGWSNSAKIILSKNIDLVHIRYESPLPHFTSTTFSSALLPLTVYQNVSLCCELTVSQ